MRTCTVVSKGREDRKDNFPEVRRFKVKETTIFLSKSFQKGNLFLNSILNG